MRKTLSLLLFAFLSLSAFAQTSNVNAAKIRASESLRVGATNSQKVVGFSKTMPGTPGDSTLTTAKCVFDWVNGHALILGATAGGDLSGTYPSPDVDGLQGRPISGTAPFMGQVYKWSGSQWVPADDDNTGTTYTAGLGISVVGSVISNTGDLSNTNEIQTVDTLSLLGSTLSLSLSGDGGPAKQVDLSSLGGGGSDGNGIYSGSGTIPDGTIALIASPTAQFFINYPDEYHAVGVNPSTGVDLFSPDNGTEISIRDNATYIFTPNTLITVNDPGLAISSPGGAFYPPVMETSQIGYYTPSLGAMVVNSDISRAEIYNGSAWGILEPLPTLGSALQQIRVNPGGTGLEYYTPTALGITDLTGDVTATGPGSVASTIASFAVTTPKIAPNAIDGTKIAMGSDVTGDIMVYNGTDYTKLAAGSTGNVLTSNGTGTIPSWASGGGGGGGGASVITPTTLSADADDYSPTGWTTATHVRLSGGSSIYAITSFAATSDGDTKHLINTGSYPMYFPSEHPDGTAANRILGYGCDFILYPGCAVDIMYDGTSSRWRLMGQELPPISGRNIYYAYSAASSTAGDNADIANINILIGTISTIASTSSLPAALQASTSTGNNYGEAFYFTKTAVTYSAFGAAHQIHTALISLPTLSTGAETYTYASQITQSPNFSGITANNTVGIRYTHSVNSGKWQGFSKDNAGTESTVDLGITVAAATLYQLTIDIDKSNTEARFYIDGVYVGRVNSNMPSSVGCGSRVIILKSAGTTARTANLHRMSSIAIYP